MESIPERKPAEAHGEKHASGLGSRTRWVFLGFAGVAAFFLFTEHRAHLLGILPYLIFLACPLMHLFHHGGHGHRHHHAKPEDRPQGEQK